MATKRRKRGKGPKTPAFVREYQKRQRELDNWLAAQLSDWLGYKVEVRVQRPKAYRPNTKAAKFPGIKIYARKMAPKAREAAVGELLERQPMKPGELDDAIPPALRGEGGQ